MIVENTRVWLIFHRKGSKISNRGNIFVSIHDLFWDGSALVSRETVKTQQHFKTREVKGRKRRTERRAREEERTERSLTHREDSVASLIGGPRCTVGASGTAFVWILGRLSCLIRYGLEIRPPRADSGKGPLVQSRVTGPTLRLFCTRSSSASPSLWHLRASNLSLFRASFSSLLFWSATCTRPRYFLTHAKNKASAPLKNNYKSFLLHPRIFN